MYRSFSVSNFRNFKSLSISDLKRINIIIGKNNTGKTSLLEALYLHMGCMHPELTLKLLNFRGIPGSEASAKAIWGSLFYQYNIDSEITLSATYPDNTKANLSISLQQAPTSLVEIKPPTDGLIEIPEKVTTSAQLPLISERMLAYKYKHRSTESTRLTSLKLKKSELNLEINPPVTDNPFPGFFIPARTQLDPSSVARRLGELQVNRKDKPVVYALRLIEPNLKSLSIIPIGPVSTIHADTGLTTLLPLQLAGEGMTNMSEIIIDIASAPKGIVLIDDIGTGIHYSVLHLFWKVIFKLAVKLD
ncbi:unnamed protein product, partial [marine sediment metagenome]